MPEMEYDRTYHIGNTAVHIVAPKITQEERDQRLAEIIRIIKMIWLETNDNQDQ